MFADEYKRKDKRVGGFPLTYTHDSHSLGSRDGAVLETDGLETHKTRKNKKCHPPEVLAPTVVSKLKGKEWYWSDFYDVVWSLGFCYYGARQNRWIERLERLKHAGGKKQELPTIKFSTLTIISIKGESSGLVKLSAVTLTLLPHSACQPSRDESRILILLTSLVLPQPPQQTHPHARCQQCPQSHT